MLYLTLSNWANFTIQGDLWEAGKLHAKADEVLLKVQTSQMKNLYLRGFSGSEYVDGTWEPLPDSAYTGVYTGLLSWLADQNFDPLTQPASYYALSNAAANASVQTNTIQLKVTGESRYYMYTPSSTATLSSPRVKEDDDVRFLAPGIRGLSSYTVQELSSSKPTELTVREDWIRNPETEEQQQYVKAEAYYRDFVYEKYLTVMVEPGEYMRAAALIEKSIYGEMELEPFEVRVIQNLIDKLSVTDCAGSKMYWKLHYRCVIN